MTDSGKLGYMDDDLFRKTGKNSLRSGNDSLKTLRQVHNELN